MAKKRCFKCGNKKDISAFYKHSEMADGYLGKCKECAKKDATKHRNENIEQIRKYDRQRGKLPHRVKRCVEYTQKYRKQYPLKNAVTLLLNRAVQAGKIKKPARCSICNTKTRIYGHHKDYYKPLEVIWLCQVCHKKIHNESRILRKT